MRTVVIVSAAALLALSACSTRGADGTPDRPPTTPTVATSSGHAQTSSTHSAPSSPPSKTVQSTAAPDGTVAPDSTAAPDSAAAPASTAASVLASMSEAERVGQLLMVDCPSTSVAAATVTAITKQHVGGVILDGNSYLSVSQTASITRSLQSHAPRGVRLLISTDQEGGLVRRLRGAGFTAIPSALDQGKLAPATLRAQAASWGKQLHAAGVNVDLAPVMDTVPSNSPGNPPIGDLDREYGHTPSVVASHGTAVAQGLATAGVAATIKHFPGLGRVTGNTDTTSGVTDRVTTRHDSYLTPFATAIKAGAPFVMMSTAIYSLLDPGTPAAFSSTIVTTILRGDLGFRGVIISDDLGNARQVSGYSVANRAVRFIAAGGDIVLTVNAGQAATMTSALLAETRSSKSFKTKVDAAALAVLKEKQALGLL